MLLSELFARFIKIKQRDCVPNTICKYEGYFTKVLDYFGDGSIDTLTGRRLDDFYFYLEDQSTKRNSIYQIHTLLGAAFEIARKQRLIEENPTHFANPPKQRYTPAKALSLQELMAVFDFLKKKEMHWQLLFLLAAYTSRRRGELLAIHFEDINWKDKTIVFSKSLKYTPKTGIVWGDTKTGVRCLNYIPEHVMFLLWDYCYANNIQSGFVFRQRDARPMHPDSPTRFCIKMSKQLGFRVHPHIFRHSCATHLFNAGVSDKDICVLLGHANVNITRRIYIHIDRQPNREIVSVLEKLYQKG